MTFKDIIKYLLEAYSQSTGVCTDTRKIETGNLFFALKGDNFNGNKFAKQALEQGASIAVIDEEKHHLDERTVLVKDVLSTLQALANAYRKTFDIPIIGITGSNGKTTTKELVTSVLKTTYRTHATSGNFNNHIGVPLTLLSMPRDTQIAVVEMGANKPNDIAELAEIAEPTHGIITNIGKAHLEGFGGLEGVARTKSALFRFLLENEGVAFVNLANEHVARMGARFKSPLTFSSTHTDAYCYGELLEVNPYIKFNYGTLTHQQTQLIGSYNFENILAALAVGKRFNVKENDAIEAVKNYTPTNNRSQVLQKGSNSILLDAYNANPTSMAAALENFSKINTEKKVVILGDMYELGETSKEEHQKIYALASQLGFDACYFLGDLFHDAVSDKSNIFTDKSDLVNTLKQISYQDTFILLKGSRGIGLEKLLEEEW